MCKVRGVGIDLCDISRMEKNWQDDRFLNRFFTPAEAAYIRGRGLSASQSMAGIFAAKEAFLKAVGMGLALPLQDIEVLHTELGQPYYHLMGQAEEAADGGEVLLSITHESLMAAAVCIWQK